jgi:hypothetical protein
MCLRGNSGSDGAGGGIGMRENERLLAEQTIHQINAVWTDIVCTVFGTRNVAAYRQTNVRPYAHGYSKIR